jgi:hypothetical protein
VVVVVVVVAVAVAVAVVDGMVQLAAVHPQRMVSVVDIHNYQNHWLRVHGMY